MTNLYFDTEFTGLQKDTSLISIGIVSDSGRKFYAEFTDYDKSKVDEWIQDNVIRNLLFGGEYAFVKDQKYSESTVPSYSVAMSGTRDMIKTELENWLKSFNDSIQFVSDVCHYDFVLFIDIFGGAFDLPDFINPSCHDINQDLARRFKLTEKAAFDLHRETIVVNFCYTLPEGNKHNSEFDAEVIRHLYHICND